MVPREDFSHFWALLVARLHKYEYIRISSRGLWLGCSNNISPFNRLRRVNSISNSLHPCKSRDFSGGNFKYPAHSFWLPQVGISEENILCLVGHEMPLGLFTLSRDRISFEPMPFCPPKVLQERCFAACKWKSCHQEDWRGSSPSFGQPTSAWRCSN